MRDGISTVQTVQLSGAQNQFNWNNSSIIVLVKYLLYRPGDLINNSIVICKCTFVLSLLILLLLLSAKFNSVKILLLL